MATQFRPVRWQKFEDLDQDKLNQMNENTQFVHNKMPRVVYRSGGVRVNDGIKMIGGLRLIPPTKKSYATARVEFGNSMFARHCNPVVVAGVYAVQQSHVNVVVRGRNGRLRPDSRGFVVSVTNQAANKKNRKLKRLLVSYIAMGY